MLYRTEAKLKAIEYLLPWRCGLVSYIKSFDRNKDIMKKLFFGSYDFFWFARYET
jgi:hypothetical protein